MKVVSDYLRRPDIVLSLGMGRLVQAVVCSEIPNGGATIAAGWPMPAHDKQEGHDRHCQAARPTTKLRGEGSQDRLTRRTLEND
jgi:poly(3-hydroxybutyrate) depolymerase